jgi:hypothetical protein
VAWGSGTRAVSSVVLIANGICFTIMTVIFVALGSAADYGTFGRWLLLFLTVVVSIMNIEPENLLRWCLMNFSVGFFSMV